MCPLNGVLFVDLKMLQLFKSVVRVRTIFKEPAGKGLNKNKQINR